MRNADFASDTFTRDCGSRAGIRSDNLVRTGVLLLLFVGISLSSWTCGAPSEQNPEIIGDTSWLDKDLVDQRQYLVRSFQGKGDLSTVIDWPPENFKRTVDVSVDVTGSGYQRESLYQGRRMPLAEHNLRKFIEERLTNELKAGDRIIMRIYGSMPGGQRLTVDEKQRLEFPQDKIEVDVKNPSRKQGHVQIIVKSVHRAELTIRNEFAQKILDWFLVFVRRAAQANERFESSPLLQYMRTVCEQDTLNNNEPKLIAFITDGHFHLSGTYYDPTTYTQKANTVDRIKRTITDMQIKPFKQPDSSTKILLFGLCSDGDEGFRRAQSDILKWFFDPQPVEIVSTQ